MTTSTSARDLTEFEVQILCEIAGELQQTKVWGDVALERCDSLCRKGYVHKLFGKPELSDLGRKWLADHPLSPKADPAAKPDASVTEASGDDAGAVAFDMAKHWRDTKEPTGDCPVCQRVDCADGFSMSVQAGKGKYSTPRCYLNDGSYTAWEVGFPSAREELLMPYVEDESRPTETVYGYVPTSVVEAIVKAHGSPATPSPDGDAETDAAFVERMNDIGLNRIEDTTDDFDRLIALARHGARTLEAAPSPAAGDPVMVVEAHLAHVIAERDSLEIHSAPWQFYSGAATEIRRILAVLRSSSPSEPAPPVTSDPVAVVERLRTVIARLFKSAHQNVCYPYCSDDEANDFIDQVIAAIRSSSKGGA